MKTTGNLLLCTDDIEPVDGHRVSCLCVCVDVHHPDAVGFSFIYNTNVTKFESLVLPVPVVMT